MKVEVLTVNDVTFRPWRWWSNWVDVCVFDWASEGYLLQMRVGRNNAKAFKCHAFKSLAGIAHPHSGSVGNLTQSKKETP